MPILKKPIRRERLLADSREAVDRAHRAIASSDGRMASTRQALADWRRLNRARVPELWPEPAADEFSDISALSADLRARIVRSRALIGVSDDLIQVARVLVLLRAKHRSVPSAAK